MSALAIRRTKAEVKREIFMKKKTVQIQAVKFPDDNPHTEVQEMLYHTCRNAFLALIQGGNREFGRKQFHLFGLVLRVRQACASCNLIPKYFIDAISEIWDDMKDKDVETMSGEEGGELFDSIVNALQKANKTSRALKAKDNNDDFSVSDDDVLLRQIDDEKVEYGRSPKIQGKYF